MPKLPKIAIERLRARPPAAPPSGASVGSGSFRGAEHPDANLVSAFVEKSLTERERSQILDHLSVCADCREVMALTVGSEPETMPLSPARAKRRSSAWPILRWGALTAALGAVAIVVVLHPYGDRKQSTLSSDQHPAVVDDATQPAPPLAAARPEQEPNAENELARSNAVPRDARTARAKFKTGPHGGSASVTGSSARSGYGQTKQQITLMPTVHPPEPLVARNVPAANAGREVSRSVGGLGGAIAAAPPAASPSSTTSSASEEAGLDVRKEAPPRPAAPPMKSASDGAKKDALLSPTAEVTATSAIGAPSVAVREARGREDSQVAAMSRLSSRQGLMSKRRAVSAQWSISTTGKVQRSEDGRKTWEDVRIADGVIFRVIAAVGKDVWAGGTAGALYHSIDGGLVWSRVNVSSAEIPVAETIVGIQLRPPLGVSVTLASGQQWVTEDGGQQWRNKP